MNTTEQLKRLRLDIDTTRNLVMLVATKANGGISKEMVDTNYSIKMAKAYVGKLLGELGNPTPYKNDGNRKTVEDIEPEDAKGTIIATDFTSSSYVEQVDTLRESIQIDLIELVSKLDSGLFTKNANIYRTQVFIHLTDARLHLGFELGRLRDGL